MGFDFCSLIASLVLKQGEDKKGEDKKVRMLRQEKLGKGG